MDDTRSWRRGDSNLRVYADGQDNHVVRFCFAKQESTLLAAAERLNKAFVQG